MKNEDREEPKEVGEERVAPKGRTSLSFVERAEAEKGDLKDLARDIIVAHDARVKVVGEIIEDTHRMMANFKTKREQMVGELQKLLARGESLRKKDFERMMADIIDAHAKREEEVKEMLENFREEEEMVAEKLRGLLARGKEVRIRDFKKMMAEIKQGQEKRIETTSGSITDQLRIMQEEVHTMLNNFKTERQSVATAWHEMLDLFHNDRALESRSAVNPVRTGASRPADGSITLPSAIATLDRRQSRRPSNGVNPNAKQDYGGENR